jgi:serine/threonine protein kinase/tetratricopeptide (TPR) repeat protein
VNGRVCVHCFLSQGLVGEGEKSAEIFGSVLGEVELADLHREFGNYEILELIGRGGMGVIYRARQRYSRRIVALKRALAYQAESAEALVRFRRETEAVAKLDHPNILPIYEVGQSEDGLPFFSMKFARGGSLRDAAEGLRTRPNECVRFMAKVARAIDCAHGQGILHRDLQPGNILLDDHDEPLVSDFGLAKWLTKSDDLTRTLTTFGTPGYIAPEQADNAAGDLTPAADVYSLGAILFYLFTGRPPFVGENMISVIRRTSLERAPKLRSLAPSLDRDLETICARCLARDPKARYQSAADLAEELERWLGGRPILARPISIPARAWRWSRRNPTLAAAAAACFLLGATILWMLPNQLNPPSALPSGEKSVAVLPFQNLSQDPANAVFADAVQNEILTNLAKVENLKVISRTSVLPYGAGASRNLREIAQELGVSHVVEGSVQRKGEHVRVNARVIDARTDRYLWAGAYDRDLTDIFAIQAEISQKIAGRLRAQLSPGERQAIASQPTQDLEAFESYIRGRVLMETPPLASSYSSDLTKAVALLERAVARDPQFALAYAALSKANSYLGHTHPERKDQRFPGAQTALNEAQRLAPDSGETHFAQALLYYYRDFDFKRAIGELEVAAQTLPNNAEVFLLRGLLDRRLGRWTDSLRHFQRATELNPKDSEAYVHALISARALRWQNEAYRIADAALKALPEKVDEFRAQKGINALLAGDLPAARRQSESIHKMDHAAVRALRLFLPLWERNYSEAQRVLAGQPEDAGQQALLAVATNAAEERRPLLSALRTSLEEQAAHDPGNHDAQEALPLLDFALGDRDKALQRARAAVENCPISKDALRGPGHLHVLATVYAWAGEYDQAFEILTTLVKVPFGVYYGGLAFDPAWDNLRDDPRFDRILAEATKPL